jgi:SAM-dependent methyltransferase
MASLAHRFAGQLAHPRGISGRLLGAAMDLANQAPTRWALDMLAPRDGERILDAGCGTGAALAGLRAMADVSLCGIDPSAEMIAAASRRLGGRAELTVADIASMPYAPGSFDAAMALNVLYFCDCEGRMVADLRRVLKPGGRLVSYVTARETMQRWPFVRAGLHRLFDAEGLKAELVKGGFDGNRVIVHSRQVTRGVTGLLAVAQA